MSDKVALVTGGSDGVGLSVVRALIQNHYHVYFIGSNAAKGKKVEAELKHSAGPQHKNTIQFIQLDLSDLKAVEQFCNEFRQSHSRLDLLLFSAGVLMPSRQTSPQGIEKTFAIGYISAYIIAKSLSALMERGDHPRIVAVSGGKGLVLKERLNFDDFNNEKFYIGLKSAIRTVHSKVVLMQWLGDSLADMGVDTISVHPGIVKSSLGQNLPVPLNWMHKLASLVMPRQSSSTIYACTSEELNGVTRQHLEGGKQAKLNFKAEYVQRVIESTQAVVQKAGLSSKII